MNLPRTGVAEWAGPQASPWDTVNLVLRLLDAGACRFLIEDRDLTAPPGSCADGACYLVAATATGAWASKDGKLAVAIGANASNGWQFMTVAIEGVRLYIRDENVEIQHNGSTWVTAGSGTAGTLDFDTDGTLAANSDSKVATQKATKTYVDAKVAGLSWKQAVRVATTANITLATALENGDAIDGVTLATGDRVLVKNQSTASENGIYTVNASGAPTRATDADSGAEMVNASVYVSEGTTNADTQWTCSTNAPITVGSTSLTFTQFNSASYSEASAAEIWAGSATGKFISPDKLFDASEVQTLTDGSTITPDFGAGLNFKVTLGGNRTLANPSNAKNGQSGIIKVIQDGTGSRTLSYGSNWRFPGGAASGGVLSTAAGSIDVIAFVVDDGGLVLATLAKAFAA